LKWLNWDIATLVSYIRIKLYANICIFLTRMPAACQWKEFRWAHVTKVRWTEDVCTRPYSSVDFGYKCQFVEKPGAASESPAAEIYSLGGAVYKERRRFVGVLMKYLSRGVHWRSFIAATVVLFPLGAAGIDPPKANLSSAVVRQEAALALIDFPWKELNYEIVFLPPRPGFRALITFSKQLIEIYARPGEDSRIVAYNIAHELGHAIDRQRNTPESRRRWMELRGINPDEPWFGCNRFSDYNTPAGDFAETFAFLLLGPGGSAAASPRPRPPNRWKFCVDSSRRTRFACDCRRNNYRSSTRPIPSQRARS
jgi:hypothetical protein